MEAQKRVKKAKPVYYGKIQAGFFKDNFVNKGFKGWNHGNFGIRKITGGKIKEYGLESFYYQIDNDVIKADTFDIYFGEPYIRGYKQKGFHLNVYQYFALKKWKLAKLDIQIGPQFSLGYYHNKKSPYTTREFNSVINDFKFAASGRIELSYLFHPRFTAIIGAQYTFLQFGLRRKKDENPTIDIGRQLEDFIQVDFLIRPPYGFFGLLTQFGKIKKDRAKIRKKKEKGRLKKKEKIQKDRQKKQYKRTRKKTRNKKKNDKKKQSKKKG